MQQELLLYLMLLPPFIGASLSWVGDKIWKHLSKLLGIITSFIAGASATSAFIMLIINKWEYPELSTIKIVPLLDAPALKLVIGPDGLGIFMALIASELGFLIALFSLEYMADDDHLTRYWFFIQLFIGGMILLVIAGDFVLMYVGWEIVGLCSFGLIGHWFTKNGEQGEKCAKAGIKAFVFTRIGDIGFLVAIIIIYVETGTTVFKELETLANPLSVASTHTICFMFLMAAFGKSAQIPFIPWLSSPENVDIDAMQGPTTVSALIHAATMVKAGVYLIARLYVINGPTIRIWEVKSFSTTITIVAGVTALITALSALVSFDIKRVLAYSTISQLAYMFLGIGVAFATFSSDPQENKLSNMAFLTSQFHLISHAIFKALLFLTAGYLIHKTHSRDMREMRGTASWNKDRVAFIGLLTGGLALSGIPPFNGFFSKELLIGVSLEATTEHPCTSLKIAYVLATLTALFTAMYVGRMFYFMFTGITEEEDHEKTATFIIMKIVIIILSVGAAIGGLFYYILDNLFKNLLDNVEMPEMKGTELISTIIMTVIVIVIFLISYYSLISWPKTVQKISEWFIIAWLLKAAREGFYLEAAWSTLWNGLKFVSYEFRRTHTGDLNWTLFTIIITGTIILTFIGG